MTSLKLVGVGKSFGDKRVLEGVSLDFADERLTAIVGPSGSGKTTILRIIAGFERVDRGSVMSGGRILDDGRRSLPARRRRIGYVPQDCSLFPHVTVEQNVAFGMSRKDRAAGETDRLLALVGLASCAKRYPHQLSGGQQQRVALARALAVRPEVILLDEPFSALDPTLRQSVRREVRGILREAGVTAVMVTHDQDEALSLADAVAVLLEGTIAQSGTPAELYDHPAAPEVAAFLGDANLLAGVAFGGHVSTQLGDLAVLADSQGCTGPVTVLIRPEAIGVRDPGPGRMRAQVIDTEFHGHDTVVRMSLADGVRLQARLDGAFRSSPGDFVGIEVRSAVRVWEGGADADLPSIEIEARPSGRAAIRRDDV